MISHVCNRKKYQRTSPHLEVQAVKCYSDVTSTVVTEMKKHNVPFCKTLKLILQSFPTLTLVNKCTVAFNKISNGCKKYTGVNFQGTLIFKLSLGEHPTTMCRRGVLLSCILPTRPSLSRQDSALAILQFAPVTFFQFENSRQSPQGCLDSSF